MHVTTDEREQTNLGVRVANAVSRLGRGYVHLARREARRDFARIVAGVALLAFGAVLCVFGVGVAHLLIAAALVEAGLGLVGALGVVVAGDVVVGFVALLVGATRLRRPVLSETRAILSDTMAALAGA